MISRINIFMGGFINLLKFSKEKVLATNRIPDWMDPYQVLEAMVPTLAAVFYCYHHLATDHVSFIR